jgi:hypothetical protein
MGFLVGEKVMKVKSVTVVARKRTTNEIVELIASRASIQEILTGKVKVKIGTSLILDEANGDRLVQALMPGQDQELAMGLMGIYA